MKRLALVILFVVMFVFVGSLQAEPVDAGDAEDSKKAETSKDAAKAKKPNAPADEMKVIQVELDAKGKPKAKRKGKGRGGSKAKSSLWWNEPGIVKAVSLTEEQRKKMGDLRMVFRKKVPESPKMAEFHEALVQGNWKNARAESDKIVARASDSVRLRGTLKIDVLSLLSKEQLKKLVDGYPRLIYKPWRRAMRADAP